MHIFKNSHFDFLRWRWHALALSWVIILAGIATIATKGIPRGVEFAGGTVVIEQFDQAVSVQQVRVALDRNYPNGGQNAVVQAYDDPSKRMVIIRVPQVGAESGSALSTTAAQVEDALRKANLGNFKRQGAEIVSATVGRELEQKGCRRPSCRSSVSSRIWRSGSSSASRGRRGRDDSDLLITFAFLAFFS
jgi:preprotein translocase subunit SecF